MQEVIGDPGLGKTGLGFPRSVGTGLCGISDLPVRTPCLQRPLFRLPTMTSLTTQSSNLKVAPDYMQNCVGVSTLDYLSGDL